jgi:hypothetical protein
MFYLLGGLAGLGLVTTSVVCNPANRPDAGADLAPVYLDDAERQRAEDLERLRRYLIGVPRLKREAIDALAQGRMNLLQAAAIFRRIHAVDPGYTIHLSVLFPNCSDTERHCRGVIHYIGNLLEDSPDTPALISRLEQELKGYLERGLPPLPDESPTAPTVVEARHE